MVIILGELICPLAPSSPLQAALQPAAFPLRPSNRSRRAGRRWWAPWWVVCLTALSYQRQPYRSFIGTLATMNVAKGLAIYIQAVHLVRTATGMAVLEPVRGRSPQPVILWWWYRPLSMNKIMPGLSIYAVGGNSPISSQILRVSAMRQG